jgi:uncharacterized membrane protein
MLSRSQRAADAVTEFCGSWTFISVFSLLTLGWMALNSALMLARVWDPYPYILLNLAPPKPAPFVPAKINR